MTATDQLAAIRLAEFARQWRLNPNIDRSGTIYNVWFDPEANDVELNLNDIEEVLAMVRERDAALERVRELHKDARKDVVAWARGHRWTGHHCTYDGEHWPCATIAAITATEGA